MCGRILNCCFWRKSPQEAIVDNKKPATPQDTKIMKTACDLLAGIGILFCQIGGPIGFAIFMLGGVMHGSSTALTGGGALLAAALLTGTVAMLYGLFNFTPRRC